MFRSIFATAGAALLLGSVVATAQEPIKVGVPMELSGRFVMFGAPGLRGTQMAIETFKGQVAGRKIEAVVRDVQSDAQVATTVMDTLINQDKVDFINGPVSSAMITASIPAWRATKPIWLAGATTTRIEEEVGKEPNFFHVYPYAYHYHAVMAKALQERLGEGKTIAVIYSDDVYGRSSLPAVKKYFPAAGFKIVTEELVRAGSSDFNATLIKIRSSRPDILLVLTQTADLVTMARQIQIARISIPYLVGGADVGTREWQSAVGDAQEKWIGISVYIPGLARPADPNRPDIFPSSLDWERRFKDRYGEEPNFNDAGNYSSMSMLLLAIEKAGAEKDKVRAELGKLDVATPLGRGKFVATEGGTLNQTFGEPLVLQRQGGHSAVLYPPDVAKGELLKR